MTQVPLCKKIAVMLTSYDSKIAEIWETRNTLGIMRQGMHAQKSVEVTTVTNRFV